MTTPYHVVCALFVKVDFSAEDDSDARSKALDITRGWRLAAPAHGRIVLTEKVGEFTTAASTAEMRMLYRGPFESAKMPASVNMLGLNETVYRVKEA